MHWEGVGVWFWSSEMTKSGNVRTIELSVLRSPDVAIFRVETVGAGDTKPSLDLGHRMVINPPSTIADRDPSANPGDLNFPIVSELAEDALLVPDVDVRELPGHEARRRTQRRRTGRSSTRRPCRGKVPPRRRHRHRRKHRPRPTFGTLGLRIRVAASA
jgi:hypothetical protein